MRPIKYISLKLADYIIWNMKVNYEKHVLARLKQFFHSQRILGKDQIENTNTYISILSKQNYVRDQILAMENRDKKK